MENAEHFNKIATTPEGIDVYQCVSTPEDGAYFPASVGNLYWLDDEDCWNFLPVSYEVHQQRDRRREMRGRAAELAAPTASGMGGPVLFNQSADAIFAFLMKD